MKEAYKTLQESSVFQDWKKEHTDYYLVHVFLMRDTQYQPDWHFGYYHAGEDRVISFIVAQDGNVTQEEKSEVLKEDGRKLVQINVEDNIVPLETAWEKAHEIMMNDYNGVGAKTKIFLLQHLEDVGFVWNITVVTLRWETVNVKIDALSGEVKQHSSHSLLDMSQNRV